MINIWLTKGVALELCNEDVDIMVDKDKVSPKLHRLRIIKILEANQKFWLATVFGKRIISFAAKYCGLSHNQYGSRGGRLCQSAILNKVLTYGILRMLKGTAFMAEFEATALIWSLE